jgi:hypothetical protein
LAVKETIGHQWLSGREMLKRRTVVDAGGVVLGRSANVVNERKPEICCLPIFDSLYGEQDQLFVANIDDWMKNRVVSQTSDGFEQCTYSYAQFPEERCTSLLLDRFALHQQ